MKTKTKIIITIIFLFSGITMLYVLLNRQPNLTQQPQCYGLYIGEDISSKKIDEATKAYVKKPCVILTFIGWSDRPFKNLSFKLDNIKKAGAIPMITLEPWLYPSKTPIELSDIVQGKQDEVLKELAEVLTDYNDSVYLRFAHEMNGNWYPWSGYNNNKETEIYIQAWRKAHEILNNHSKNKKIRWVWAINAEDIPNRSWNRPKNYYPGDNYVDAIGIDGYNWGKTKEWWSGWKSFNRIFRKQIKNIRKDFGHKEIFITEVASATLQEKRSFWISDLFDKLIYKYSYIPFFIWFDINKESKWNIDGDKKSIEAFNTGLLRLKQKTPKDLFEAKEHEYK